MFGLFKRVLPGRAVKYQKNFVRGVGNNFTHHVLNFGKLVHQVDFVVQTTGSIYDYHIGIVCFCRTQRIKSYRCGIGTHLLFYHGHSHTFTPDIKLFHSCSTKGIGCTKIYRQPILFELMCQLPDSSGLPHPVHPDNHNNVWLFIFRNGKLGRIVRIILGKQLSYLFTKNSRKFIRTHILVAGNTFFYPVNYFQCSVHTYIRSYKYFFQFIEYIVVHP
ncbi:hypothetical protein SDC9_147899 [bioreactor metagenome]|uniref:Uncharacterized protein n=1 Tax=bioreactor metagenome TaxID=1076179 RepID=A0A645EJG1_9ZZZZ